MKQTILPKYDKHLKEVAIQQLILQRHQRYERLQKDLYKTKPNAEKIKTLIIKYRHDVGVIDKEIQTLKTYSSIDGRKQK